MRFGWNADEVVEVWVNRWVSRGVQVARRTMKSIEEVQTVAKRLRRFYLVARSQFENNKSAKNIPKLKITEKLIHTDSWLFVYFFCEEKFSQDRESSLKKMN